MNDFVIALKSGVTFYGKAEKSILEYLEERWKADLLNEVSNDAVSFTTEKGIICVDIPEIALFSYSDKPEGLKVTSPIVM